ncbi:hypothetical protein [Rhodopirellula sp. P2]|uniref:hypothetical protein n=1 Tax=Rhodopirellula sp. P2 TaxID=2127060 RepID=UPI002368D3E8|nr:hypothetical protein [Rhodopirellula sp. P2]WDQ17254.1 hypothetical protein PSR62_01555 [Rhodopirellula sp. P2]
MLVIWAAVDPSFESLVHDHWFSSDWMSANPVRGVGIVLIGILAVGSLLGLLLQFFVRSASMIRRRSLAQLLVMATLVAFWCALAIHLDSIAWQGKRARFAMRVQELERIAGPLREQWPQRDGELPAIGPFMAYPFGRPTTLILLQAPPVAKQSVYVSAIESQNGAIKLQLTGTDGGDWAEWHPRQSRPSSFVGGLSDPHELEFATSIGCGWYLVRYRS